MIKYFEAFAGIQDFALVYASLRSQKANDAGAIMSYAVIMGFSPKPRPLF